MAWRNVLSGMTLLGLLASPVYSKQADRITCYETSCTTPAYQFMDFDKDQKVDAALDRKKGVYVESADFHRNHERHGRNYKVAKPEELAKLQRAFEDAKSHATRLETDNGQLSCYGEIWKKNEFYMVRCIDSSKERESRIWGVYPPYESVRWFLVQIYRQESDKHVDGWVDHEKDIDYSEREYHMLGTIPFERNDATGVAIADEARRLIGQLERATGARLVIDGKTILQQR